MLEKPCIKIIDFDTFVFFTTESKSITFNTGLFLEDLFSLRRKSQIWIIVFPEGVYFTLWRFQEFCNVKIRLGFLPGLFHQF